MMVSQRPTAPIPGARFARLQRELFFPQPLAFRSAPRMGSGPRGGGGGGARHRQSPSGCPSGAVWGLGFWIETHVEMVVEVPE